MTPAMLAPELGEAWIPTSRGPVVFFAVVCLVFAVASAAVVGSGDRGGWLGVVLFGGGVVVFIWRLVSPGGVQLTRDGFTRYLLGRRSSQRWSEVEGFQVVELAYSNKAVGYRLRNPSQRGMSGVNRAMTGVDALLPTLLSVKPQELAPIMDAWRARYGDGAAERS